MSAARDDRQRSGVSPYPIELLTPSEMAEADRAAAAGSMPGSALMERAGAAVAEAVVQVLRDDRSRRVLVLCGPGSNGGDGFVAARRLKDAGWHVTLAAVCAPSAYRGDAAQAASRWAGDLGSLELATSDLSGFDLIVDALLGAGLARPVEGDMAAAIGAVNDWRLATSRPVLAVDVPSGLDGATGLVRGLAIEASHTITFFRLKPGHILLPGRVRCGHIMLADIGIEAGVLEAIRPQTYLNTSALWRADYPIPTLAGHKYARGHAVVVSGSLAHTGAARLSARGALRIGAGLVTVATPADALAVHAAALTAVMTQVADDAAGLRDVLADPRKNAVVLGPGLGVGDATRAKVHAALSAPGPDAPRRSVVLDADALTSFADRPDELFAAVRSGEHRTVLTPHDGEFGRLFGKAVDPAADKLARTRAAAQVSGATVLLKGPDTVVADPDGRACVAMSQAPWLATAGSGDVLAGMVGGLLAQGMPPFQAASAAVWLHAAAAQRFGPGLISEDIPEALPGVLRDLFAGAEDG